MRHPPCATLLYTPPVHMHRFNELAKLIEPDCTETKVDKPSILQDAIKCVRQMTAENHQLKMLNKFLEVRWLPGAGGMHGHTHSSSSSSSKAAYAPWKTPPDSDGAASTNCVLRRETRSSKRRHAHPHNTRVPGPPGPHPRRSACRTLSARRARHSTSTRSR
jgi:hypothetical protein